MVKHKTFPDKKKIDGKERERKTSSFFCVWIVLRNLYFTIGMRKKNDSRHTYAHDG